jgi:hypothetical protein
MKSVLLHTLLVLSASTFAQKIFVSEFHYDDPGADAYEFVELTGLADNKLDCYKLYYINATSGPAIPYTTKNLTDSVITAQASGYGTLLFNTGTSNQIHNGTNDGFLLFDSCLNKVVQFISYEGIISGVAPFTEANSIDVGVIETQSPDTASILLTGTLPALAWSKAANSPDTLNPGLVFPSTALTSLSGNIFLKALSCDGYNGPRASVSLFSAGVDDKLGTSDDETFSIPTSPEGRFVFANVTTGMYLLQVNPPIGYTVIDENPAKILIAATDNYFSFCLDGTPTGLQDQTVANEPQVLQSEGRLSILTGETVHNVSISNVVGQTENHKTGSFTTTQKGLVNVIINTDKGIYRKRVVLQ